MYPSPKLSHLFQITGQLSVQVIVDPHRTTHQASSSINLTCTVMGMYSTPLTYHWTSTCTGKCFVLLGRTPTLTESSLHSIDSGNHTCTVTDALGNSGTASTEIVVSGKALYSFIGMLFVHRINMKCLCLCTYTKTL